jgi:hypothetical protein
MIVGPIFVTLSAAATTTVWRLDRNSQPAPPRYELERGVVQRAAERAAQPAEQAEAPPA